MGPDVRAEAREVCLAGATAEAQAVFEARPGTSGDQGCVLSHGHGGEDGEGGGGELHLEGWYGRRDCVLFLSVLMGWLCR